MFPRALFQLQDGSKAYGSKTLFDRATFSINEGEHCGVIGPNGAGKTTLFKVLVGEEELDAGHLVFSKNIRLGYLTQHEDFGPELTVEQYFLSESQMPIWDVKALGNGLGLTEEFFQKKILSLSGGYRMRVKLLKLLSQEPDLLLLDEPTNYLDLETLLVLERFLQSYRGAFLLISHDREFLRRTTDHTLEVEGTQITKYPGMIDDYFEQKELLASQLQARAMTLEQKRNEILHFVNRFGAKATKAAQAQSRLKMLSKMESIELKPLPVKARIRIPEPIRTGKIVISLSKATLGYIHRESNEPTSILKKVDLNIMAGDHCAIIGLNGAGKSTLLKSLAGDLDLLSGERKTGHLVDIGFYAQHVSEGLNLNQTVFESMSEVAHSTLVQQDVLDCAGSLLFSGEDVYKQISVLSGGERSRVALGRILLSRASCLILDEPTNHLDFQTVEALTVALKNYKGAVVIVSHDRSFIQRIGTKILEVKNSGVHIYPGSYEEYVWSLQQSQSLGGARDISKNERVPKNKQTSEVPVSIEDKINYKNQKKEWDRQIRSLEKEILQLEIETKNLQDKIQKMNDLFIEDASSVSKENILKLGNLQKEFERKEAHWLLKMEEKEEILKEIEVKKN